MDCIGHQLGDYISLNSLIKTKFSFHKDISLNIPMLMLWILLVVSLVSNMIILFLHTNAISHWWAILANIYLRWYDQNLYGVVFFISLDGWEVHSYATIPSYLHKGEESVVPQSNFPYCINAGKVTRHREASMCTPSLQICFSRQGCM